MSAYIERVLGLAKILFLPMYTILIIVGPPRRVTDELRNIFFKFGYFGYKNSTKSQMFVLAYSIYEQILMNREASLAMLANFYRMTTFLEDKPIVPTLPLKSFRFYEGLDLPDPQYSICLESRKGLPYRTYEYTQLPDYVYIFEVIYRSFWENKDYIKSYFQGKLIEN